MHHRYHINLFWSDEDECWIADVPDLTYCSAHGPTPEAALAEVETAICASRRSGRGRAIRSRAALSAGDLCSARCGVTATDVVSFVGPLALQREVPTLLSLTPLFSVSER